MATILVVDDEEPILSIVSEVIEEMGHEVLVITDVMMPFMNGLELCQAVKSDQATRQIVVLLMSAVPVDRGRSAGADGFVHKPFSLDEIETAVTAGLSEEHAGSTA